jgi:hypothetical protein
MKGFKWILKFDPQLNYLFLEMKFMTTHALSFDEYPRQTVLNSPPHLLAEDLKAGDRGEFQVSNSHMILLFKNLSHKLTSSKSSLTKALVHN